MYNNICCNIIWIQANDYKSNKKLIPKNIRNNYQKIKKLNPEIEIKTWADNDITEFIKNNYKQYLDTYLNIKDLRFKSDLARLLILYEFGGIYLDSDQEVLRSLNDFGINNNTELCLVKSEENNRIANGFMYVKNRKNPFILKCIDNYINILQEWSGWSGCDAINNILLQQKPDNLVILVERPIKKKEECNNITEFYMSFYMFHNNLMIMRSRYNGYYTDKEDIINLVDFS